ncbi:MAG TPA: NfeD family protein [Dehalococcoidales bacterium]|nr:MAG: hypothetical protein A2Z05_00480 [Chloroflexi bacterium RBG_16_60_22]HJX12582.1 NfeD family protein [Dehalococcoidales bacterium]
MKEKDRISTGKAWLIVLISLIDDIVILAVIVLAVWYFKIRLPLWAWIVIGLLLLGFIFVRTWLVVPALRRKKITGAEGMLGLTCEVIEALTPQGVVRIGVEYWRAVSLEGEIGPGEEVEIVEIERLKLGVKRKS